MNTLQEKLDTISENWLSIERDILEDKIILTVGFPKKWEIRKNDVIDFEILEETDVGRIVKIVPKNNKTTIDDLIKFVEVVIFVNTEIAKKEDEFAQKMEEMKKKMENEISSFYKNFDKEKSQIFTDLTKVTPRKRTKKTPEKETLTQQ
jgi:hypothetical protein